MSMLPTSPVNDLKPSYANACVDPRAGRRTALLITAMFVAVCIAAAVPTFAQSATSDPANRLEGLRVVAARRVTVEGKQGIEVNLDALSAVRLLHFTVGGVGRRLTIMVRGRRLATLRLLDPLRDEHILLTGDLDSEVADVLCAPNAMVEVAIE